jgi:hypothetical protein
VEQDGAKLALLLVTAREQICAETRQEILRV